MQSGQLVLDLSGDSIKDAEATTRHTKTRQYEWCYTSENKNKLDLTIGIGGQIPPIPQDYKDIFD
jgi:hypothetical protein